MYGRISFENFVNFFSPVTEKEWDDIREGRETDRRIIEDLLYEMIRIVGEQEDKEKAVPLTNHE